MSYQNVLESQVEGYNDCTILPMMATQSTVAAAAAKRKMYRKVSSGLSPTLPQQSTFSAPPTPPIGRKFPPTNKSSSSSSLASMNMVSPVSVTGGKSKEEVLEAVFGILEKPSGLKEMEFQHYKKKLNDLMPEVLENDKNRAFVESVLEDVESGKYNKQRLLDFMVLDHSTSTWCVPLRKIIDSLA